MKKLASKWNMSSQHLSIMVAVVVGLFGIFVTIIGASWKMSERLTIIEYDSRINVIQNYELSKKLDTLSIIAIKAFENSKLLELKKQDKEVICPGDIKIMSATKQDEMLITLNF